MPKDDKQKIKKTGSKTSVPGQEKKGRKSLILHPFILGIYPVLYLLGHNIREMLIGDAIRSFVIALFFAGLLYGIGILIFRDRLKTGLVVSLALLLFYTYGRMHALLDSVKILGSSLGNLRYLGPFYLILFAIGIWLILKVLRNRKLVNDILNVASILLLVIPVIQITTVEAQKLASNLKTRNAASQEYAETGTIAYKPDIYYIILDAYARQDVLQEEFSFDNSQFLSELRDLGFFVADCSLANYGHTNLSLSDAFEMEYLQDLYRGMQELPSWSNTALLKFLREQGYTVYTLEDEFHMTPSLGADIVIPHSTGLVVRSGFFGTINKFEVMLIESSAAVIIENARNWFPQANLETTRLLNFYKDTFYWLDQAKQLPEKEGPKFVLLHFFVPHDPFVFNPDGAFIEIPDDPKIGYINSVQFIDNQIIPVVRSMIHNSTLPPVIIIQGDHGPSQVPGTTEFQRMAILNAYYLPYDGNEVLYPAISPVNTFRVILNLYFGQDLPQREDISYYTPDRSLDSLFNHSLVIVDPNPGCSAVVEK